MSGLLGHRGLLLGGSTSPVHTYATWNPSDKTAGITLTGGDLVASEATASVANVRCTQFKSVGKWYCEAVMELAGSSPFDCFLGLRRQDEAIGSAFNVGQTMVARYNGTVWAGSSGATTGTGTAFVSGDTLMLAVDLGTQKLWIGKNGTWMNSGDPAAGTGALFSGFSVASPWAAVFCTDNSNGNNRATANFGASALAYAVPGGFNSGWYV